MKRRTKIVCTLGPAVQTKEAIQALITAGMNVARLNCSHGDWAAKRQWIEWIRELSPAHSPVAILADLQGPKFRVGDIPGGGIEIINGQRLTVGPDCDIPIFQEEILNAFKSGDRLLLGDGEVEIRLAEKEDGHFIGEVVIGGSVKSRKGVTLVNKVFDVNAITDKDEDDIVEAIENDVDFIALSYVKSASDIRDLKRRIERAGGRQKVCAKIETREAVTELNDILKVVDIIMVARGDLGLQVDIEEVPAMQKSIIEQCSVAGVPVITATQMLESMTVNARPTRAEAGDVFNAIMDGTDAVMLSGETAAGKYPIVCVETMSRICEAADSMILSRPPMVELNGHDPQTDAIARATSQLERVLKPKAIVTVSTSGQTPRLICKFRPRAPILCASWNIETVRYMSVVWGTEAALIPGPNDTDENLFQAVEAFARLRMLRTNDSYIFTGGSPAGTAGNTNLILTQTVK